MFFPPSLSLSLSLFLFLSTFYNNKKNAKTRISKLSKSSGGGINFNSTARQKDLLTPKSLKREVDQCFGLAYHGMWGQFTAHANETVGHNKVLIHRSVAGFQFVLSLINRFMEKYEYIVCN